MFKSDWWNAGRLVSGSHLTWLYFIHRIREFFLAVIITSAPFHLVIYASKGFRQTTIYAYEVVNTPSRPRRNPGESLSFRSFGQVSSFRRLYSNSLTSIFWIVCFDGSLFMFRGKHSLLPRCLRRLRSRQSEVWLLLILRSELPRTKFSKSSHWTIHSKFVKYCNDGCSRLEPSFFGSAHLCAEDEVRWRPATWSRSCGLGRNHGHLRRYLVLFFFWLTRIM